MQCSIKKEDKSLIHVENVETTYFNNCAFFATLASLLLVCFIHPSLASLTLLEVHYIKFVDSIIGFRFRRVHYDYGYK